MQKVYEWWQRGLIGALVISIALLGVGRLELFDATIRFSSWSVSRTTFFFWLAFKLTVGLHNGWSAVHLHRLAGLAPLFLFLGVVTVSLLPDFHAAGDYRYFLLGCAHSIMVVDLFVHPRPKRWPLFLSGFVPVVLVGRGLFDNPAVFQLVLTERFAFPLDHANTAGYVLAMTIPLAVAVVLTSKWIWRVLGGASLAAQASALLLTYSRGAWLGCGAALLFLLVATRKWQWIAAIGVLSGSFLLLVPSLGNRLVSLARPSQDTSLSGRSYLFRAALQVGLDHPLLGVGYGRGRLKAALRPHLRGTPLENRGIFHAHNVYAEMFAGTGLFGLFAFLWLLGTVFVRLLAAVRTQDCDARILGLALASSWIAMIVAGFGDVPFYHHETRILFFTLIGAAALYSTSKQETIAPVAD